MVYLVITLPVAAFNIYDGSAWGSLGTMVLATMGVIGFFTFVSWFFGSRND